MMVSGGKGNYDAKMGLMGKEICCGCQTAIEDRFLLRVMDHSWHEHCLLCSVCQEPLTKSCFFKDARLFCRADYEKFFGTKCSGCLSSIPAQELVMRAAGHVYHVRCFQCIACGHTLVKGDQFVVKDGHLYCKFDFEKEFLSLNYSPAPHQGHLQPDWYSGYSPKSEEDSSMDEGDGLDTPKAPKRPRTILTTKQRKKFKESFELNSKPCRKVRESLAIETGLSVRVVQVWFQNQRAKMKKLQRRQNQDGGEKKASGGSGKSENQKKNLKKEETDGCDVPSNETSSGSVYSSQDLVVGDFEASIGLDAGSLDALDHVIGGAGDAQPSNRSAAAATVAAVAAAAAAANVNTVNPIDKLYSMQSSYFSAE